MRVCFRSAAWALPAAVVLLIWAPQSLRADHASWQARRSVSGLWSDPLAWQITFFMGLQSALAYCVLGWMAPILRDRGMDGIDAGLVVSVSIFVQVFTCLLVPPMAMRCKDQRLLNAALGLISSVARLGLLLAPFSPV